MKLFGKKYIRSTLIIFLFLLSFSVGTKTSAITAYTPVTTGPANTLEQRANNFAANKSGVTVIDGETKSNTSDPYGFGSSYNSYYNDPSKKEYLENTYGPTIRELYNKQYEIGYQIAVLEDSKPANWEAQKKALETQSQQLVVATKEKLGWDKKWEEKNLQQMKDEIVYCFRGSLSGGLRFSFPGCMAIGSYAILYLSSWVLSISASLFDYAIGYSLGMSVIFDEFKAISYGWEMLRNLINLFFILILVYISIATILRIESYGYKKLLGKLVIAAVLINFSMFFTKIMIDVSNVVAIVFYKQINDRAQQSTSNSGASKDNKQSHISYGIINALGLQEVWGVGSSIKSKTNTASSSSGLDPASISKDFGIKNDTISLNPWAMTLVGLGGTVFVLILSFVFFAAGVMFLGRTIMLIGLAVVSPVAFTAGILPQTAKLADGWWKKMRTNLLFAPAYMIMMFIALEMLWGNSSGQKGGGFMSLFTAEDFSAIGNVFYFIFMCVLLTMPLAVAASFGAMGSKKMQGWGSGLGKWGKNFAINRATAPVSWGLNKASKSTTLAKIATGNSAIGRFIGSRSLQGLDKLAQSKLGGDSSYRSRVDADKKAIEERAKLATSTLKQRSGESALAYFKRTGYAVDKLNHETDTEYEERTGITATQRNNAKKLKAATNRAYGLTSEGDMPRGGFMFKGAELAAMDQLDTSKKKSAAEAVNKIHRELYHLDTGGNHAGIIGKIPTILQDPADIATANGYLNNRALKPEERIKKMTELLSNYHSNITTGASPSSIITLRTAKNNARNDRDRALANLNTTLSDPSSSDIDKARAQANYNNYQQAFQNAHDSLADAQAHVNEIEKVRDKIETYNNKIEDLKKQASAS